MGLFKRVNKDSKQKPVGSDVLLLDIPRVVRAHRDMRDRLYAQIEGHGGISIEADKLAQDNACELGRWIHGQGEDRYGQHPLFNEIKMTHAMFHLCAAQVLRAAEAGDLSTARHMLHGSDSEYAHCVEQVTEKLEAFGRAMGQ